MKKKINLTKKLSFNKETIAKLNDKQKEMLQGGSAAFETQQGGTCVSYAYTCNG